MLITFHTGVSSLSLHSVVAIWPKKKSSEFERTCLEMSIEYHKGTLRPHYVREKMWTSCCQKLNSTLLTLHDIEKLYATRFWIRVDQSHISPSPIAVRLVVSEILTTPITWRLFETKMNVNDDDLFFVTSYSSHLTYFVCKHRIPSLLILFQLLFTHSFIVAFRSFLLGFMYLLFLPAIFYRLPSVSWR